MKRIITILVVVLLALNIYAESPQKVSYQAVVRNSANQLIKDAAIGLRITVLQGSESGSVIYSETQLPTSNSNGLISIEIGAGSVVSGDFAAIDWSDGPFFVKTEVDTEGGSAYSISSTAQLLSVPYALHANTAEKITGTITETDPVFSQTFELSGAAAGDILGFDGTKWSKQTPSYVNNSSETQLGDLMFYDGTNWVSKKLSVSVAGSNYPVSIMQPYLTVNYCIALEGVFPSRNILEPFIGTIAAFGFYFAPYRWATCDGQLLAIAQNVALFSLLGTTYGGNGITTFGLPDLRGRVQIHQGKGPALTNEYIMGQSGGSETITLTSLNLPTHTHVIVYE